MSFSVYPPPKNVKYSNNSSKNRTAIENCTYVKLRARHSANFTGALRRFVKNCHQNLEITFGNIDQQDCLVTIEIRKIKSQHPEYYELVNSDTGITLYAPQEVGLFRGLATLAQILKQYPRQLPHFRISDEPDFKNRGVMLDVSRCKVPTLETLRKLIDRFADVKYNQLQLYTEHTFAFSQHPSVWAQSSPYTASDMILILQYCQERYIELVPNLNCFGHFERWLRHPDYKKFAECPEGFIHPVDQSKIPFGSTLKPNKQSLGLLNELYSEYLPLFDSPVFNVGGDEPWELGKGWSAATCKEKGSTQTYVDFMLKIKGLSEKHGKTMMFWSDIVLKQPDSLKTLSKDLIAMNWGYEGNHPFKRECEQVAKQNIPYYVCPGTSSWNSLTGRTTNMITNLSNAARNGIRYGAMGYLVTDWGDHGHHQYLPLSYPGFALGACESWNHRASKNLDLEDMLNTIFFNEETSTSAKLILQLGRVNDLSQTPKINSTIFNQLLFNNKISNENQPTDENLNRCEDEFTDIKFQLSLLRSEDSKVLRLEIKNAIAMARFGIKRLRLARGELTNETKLREDLALIVNQHEMLWLSRNRPGGLVESTRRLLKINLHPNG
jgi:hexosaminidase